jgi:hypothetical protein
MHLINRRQALQNSRLVNLVKLQNHPQLTVAQAVSLKVNHRPQKNITVNKLGVV